MPKEYRINVYRSELKDEVVARVRYNSILDYWDGNNWTSGATGRHKGLTKLRNGDYVLIHGTDWQGERDWGVIISKEQALQEILRSQNLDLLKTKKFAELNELYKEMESEIDDEDLEEEAER